MNKDQVNELEINVVQMIESDLKNRIESMITVKNSNFYNIHRYLTIKLESLIRR
jgi:hypothetical protein